MNNIYIDNLEDLKHFLAFLESSKDQISITEQKLNDSKFVMSLNNGQKIIMNREFKDEIEKKDAENDEKGLIFGKDPTERVVNVEVDDTKLTLFIETESGIETKVLENESWVVAAKKLDDNFTRLEGNLPYRFIRKYKSLNEFDKNRAFFYKNDTFFVGDEQESNLIIKGITYFKGMKLQDLSVLSVDLESTTLEHTKDAKVLLISNTFRKNGKVEKKLFAYDDYSTEKEFFEAWAAWVREKNPSVVIGHNIYTFDLPYLHYCAGKCGAELRLGRDNSILSFNDKESKKRKDASQYISYHKAYIYGREIVDTFFLSLTYDIGRKYTNYRLKTIIKEEGLEKKGRQFYDAATIRFKYLIPEEWVKIKAYCVDDSDDSLALFDLMVASYFYLCQSVPKSFTQMINSASGSQVNSVMIRAYLQNGHSLPKKSAEKEFEGAISFGNPGVYHNVFKIDVASLYPSIMRHFKIYDPAKDPKGYFLKAVEFFTLERLRNKKQAKDTGNKYYKDLEQSQKIFINSAYGFLGASGLLFNSPENAEAVTRHGREILTQAIKWAESKGLFVINADTDSIAFNKDNKAITEEERKAMLAEVNSLYPPLIRWEDDGYYKNLLVIKAKNYILDDGDKRKIKGSALKATTKEKALKEFIDETIKLLLSKKKDRIIPLYYRYVKEIYHLSDISRWSSKKTVTSKVLTGTRANESKVLQAIEDTEYVEGDKIYTYFDVAGNVKLMEHWKNDHDPIKLVDKLYKTLQTFENVLDMGLVPDLTLKRNKDILEEVLC